MLKYILLMILTFGNAHAIKELPIIHDYPFPDDKPGYFPGRIQSQRTQHGDRSIRVLDTHFQLKDKKDHPWIKEMQKAPVKFYTQDILKYSKMFDDIGAKFLACVAKEKWPAKTKCNTDIYYCHTHPSDTDADADNTCSFNTQYFTKADTYYHNLTKRIVEYSEENFNLLVGCFDKSRQMDMSFYPFGPKAEREDIAAITIRPNPEDIDAFPRCYFNFINGKLHLMTLTHEDRNHGRFLYLKHKHKLKGPDGDESSLH